MNEVEILNLSLEKKGLEHFYKEFGRVSPLLEKELSSVIRDNKKIISLIAEVMIVLRQISMGLGIARIENEYREKVYAMSEAVGGQGRAFLEMAPK